MHKQVQIAPGVYITDFRKEKTLTGLTQTKSELTNDVGLLLDQIQALQLKINQLLYTIQQIQKQQNWQQDKDFCQSIQDNWKCIAKFSYQMKQKVLWLFQLKYHPQTQKIQDLLKINRIQQREQIALNQVKKILSKYNKELKQKGVQLAQVSDQEDQEQQKKKEEDSGVFV